MNLTQWGMEFGCAPNSVRYSKRSQMNLEKCLLIWAIWKAFMTFFLQMWVTDGNESYINVGW